MVEVAVAGGVLVVVTGAAVVAGNTEVSQITCNALLAALEGLRAVNLAVLEGVDDDGRRRLGVHGEQGEEQFDLTVRKVAGHDLAHLNQLARTVAAATVPHE